MQEEERWGKEPEEEMASLSGRREINENMQRYSQFLVIFFARNLYLFLN